MSFAAVTAGWQEREPADGELARVLGGRHANLGLYRRWLDLLDRDREYAIAERDHRAVLDELRELYLVQLDHALRAVYAVAQRSARPRVRAAALADAESAVRLVDLKHAQRVRAAHGDRLVEYANSTAHARFLGDELVPRLEADLPLAGDPAGRCLMGSSFGAVAALAAAYRAPHSYGALLLLSGSFVFTDIGTDHGGGAVFDEVVKFVNRYRARPRRVADRVFVSCGVYEPLIVRNRSMVPTFESTGTTVRYVEARDGHSWENWRDRLRDALSWIYPGPQKLVYE
jgi:esterase/lipase superfamily enzyme